MIFSISTRRNNVTNKEKIAFTEKVEIEHLDNNFIENQQHIETEKIIEEKVKFERKPINEVNVWLIRHGQAEHNVGSTSIPDPGLTQLGKIQAEKVKLDVIPDMVLFSPLKRTIETTDFVFKSNEVKDNTIFKPFVDLQETFAGKIPCDTGRNPNILKKEFPHHNFDELENQWYKPKIDQKKRVKRFYDDFGYILEGNTQVESVVIISHQGTIDAMTGLRIKNCDVLKCKFLVKERNLKCK